ncbi:hypothetical protein RQP54_17775 [Curvibacter sp. APW13]|uniref:hypothetical protein n=1 Tax=Curvibacter sp. APW13 TaxID=3077236 RepID=UPI0028DFBFA9|nr:hypothetical protein [Curvibacter sp. APW13]MDT8992726.1 hypothetical protein [Curvibacter sp. APW13]
MFKTPLTLIAISIACSAALAQQPLVKPVQVPLQMYEVSDGAKLPKPSCPDARTAVINLAAIDKLVNGQGALDQPKQLVTAAIVEQSSWRISVRDQDNKSVPSRVVEARIYCL